ncbi:MAG: hypothetical protein AUJ75_03370 [Candidatus Omnitrophica bacterium CG1_02_49_10]|nr:MAG: hypothetical protein AUJ75_03370 [Candidatus Omnitrophica bacterium CG1_02_49_10]
MAGADNIKDVVKTVMAHLQVPGAINKEDITDIWSAAVGDKFARNSEPVTFKKGVLTVSVEGSTWLYELELMKEKIMVSLKDSMGERFKDLRLKVGEVKIGKKNKKRD